MGRTHALEELSALTVPSMPMGILIPASLLFTALIAITLWRLRDWAGGFVVFVIWLRMMTGAFHVFSFSASPLGLSWNALISIATVACGFFIIRKSQLMLRILVPIYVLIGVVIASGIVNAQYGGLVSAAMKLGLLIVLVLAATDAAGRLGDRFLQAVLAAFAPPFLLQLLSIPLGITKATEMDGSASYIGGFAHEAAFSMIVMTAMFAVAMIRDMRLSIRLGLVGWCLAALLLANYRTTMIAFLPFFAVVALRATLIRMQPSHRPVLLLATLCLAFGGIFASSSNIGARFADLSVVTTIDDYLSRSPDSFNKEERRIMSGRPYIWSQYVDGWRSGPPHYRIIGAGPEVYPPGAKLYAHNTLISALFEYGLIGLFVYAWLLAALALPAFRAEAGEKSRLLTVHAGFLILNMATMPLWNIEGVMMYALFVGYTLSSARRGRDAAALAQWREAERPQPQFA